MLHGVLRGENVQDKPPGVHTSVIFVPVSLTFVVQLSVIFIRVSLPLILLSTLVYSLFMSVCYLWPHMSNICLCAFAICIQTSVTFLRVSMPFLSTTVKFAWFYGGTVKHATLLSM